MARYATPTRWTVLTAALALIVTGCTSAPGAAPHPAGTPARAPAQPIDDASFAELQHRVAAAASAPPYSATFRSRTLLDGQIGADVTARLNLNTEMTGRFESRSIESDDTPVRVQEWVVTEDGFYARTVEPAEEGEAWERTPKSTGPAVADLTGYARLLLKQGPAAVQGLEVTDGVEAGHLSGKIATADISALEPNVQDQLQVARATSFDCDVWVDGSGRVVRLEQRFPLGGAETRTVVTLSGFGKPFTQKAPAL